MRSNISTGANTETTALAVTHNIIGQVMTPADITALDSLIETLGSKSANLSPDEKAGAISVIDNWDKSVTARIKDNAERARSILSFLDGGPQYGDALYETIELFHEVIGDTPEYQAYIDARENYAGIQADYPLEVPVQGEMTVVQSDKIYMENYAARLEHQRKLKMAEHTFAKAVKAYIKALNNLPDIKTLRSNLTNYKNKAQRLAVDCSDKAARARLNITVSDPDIRAALHDMMDFAKKI